MQLTSFLSIALLVFFVSCKKENDKPKSKTDYLPINFASTPLTVKQGQSIISRVNCGFYNYFADITFLGFEIKKENPNQYSIKAKAFYDKIHYGIAFNVVSTFDTTVSIQANTPGQYILKFYSTEQLVQTDTVEVN